MAAAGGQQAHPQDQAQHCGHLAGAGDAMLFHVIPPFGRFRDAGRRVRPGRGDHHWMPAPTATPASPRLLVEPLNL